MKISSSAIMICIIMATRWIEKKNQIPYWYKRKCFCGVRKNTPVQRSMEKGYLFVEARKRPLSKSHWRRRLRDGKNAPVQKSLEKEMLLCDQKNAPVWRSMENCSWSLLLPSHLQENLHPEILLVYAKANVKHHSYSWCFAKAGNNLPHLNLFQVD